MTRRRAGAGCVAAAHRRRENVALIGGANVQEQQIPHRYAPITRALCAVIVVLMLVGILYAGWISITNFAQIGV